MDQLETRDFHDDDPAFEEEATPARFARGSMSTIPEPASADDVVAIAHDLRGPLSVISLEATLLEDEPSVSRDARSALARIGRNLRYIDYLLQDLLDLAAIDAARFEIRGEPTELCGLVAEVIARMVPTRDRDRVVLTSTGVVEAIADAHRIERVVANLLHNALKYSCDSPIAVVVEADGDLARVSVIDQGPGLPPDEVSCVFDKFRRASTSKRSGGTGLGLYVSRRIIEAHHGRIAVSSTFGHGSRFEFELPLLCARSA